MIRLIERKVTRPSHPGMVGDGFRVYNYIPRANITQQRISPFLLLDFNAEYDFGPSETLLGVGVHPHKGFETVTIAYKGSVAHHDSAGNKGVIYPGDVQWMTAGAGILHKEFHEEEFSLTGGPFEMVQLWVNLPKKDKLTAPHYQAISREQIGKFALADGRGEVHVIAGQYQGIQGAATTYSPVNVFDVRLKAGGAVDLSFPDHYNTAILVVNGSVLINGEEAEEHTFILFKNAGEEIFLTATEETVLLVLSGEPLNEPIVSYGPFVMNTHEEIEASIQEFHDGKFGMLT